MKGCVFLFRLHAMAEKEGIHLSRTLDFALKVGRPVSHHYLRTEALS